jgi:hypothetical protein
MKKINENANYNNNCSCNDDIFSCCWVHEKNSKIQASRTK